MPVAAAEPGPRVRYTINEGWRYAPGTIDGAEASGYDDGAWQAVDLPHTWNAEDAFDDSPDYRRGVGWYRKRLALDPALRGRRLFLHFEGANQVAEVFVDGRAAGRHVGGYTAFAFDVTELVRFDAPTVLAVRVDNSHDPDVPPLDADFTFYGGIYRDVWLIATAPVNLAVLDHASPGVYVDTPEVSAERAAVRVRGTVVGAGVASGGEAQTVEVVSRVRGPEGRDVAVLRARVTVPAGGEAVFETAGEVVRPRLWSPDSPAVYRVATEVVAGGRIVDRVEVPLGFRWFRADPQLGFLLNGRPLRLTGTNRHQDREGFGNALPDAAHREDVELIAATGFDFLRLAHYPQDPAVLEAMDRLGLVGWEEIPVVNTITLSDEFADNAERMLVEMIRQHYNHPSIVFWGIMNEALLRPPDPPPAGYREAVAGLARRLHERARREDPSRPTALAISHGEIDDPSGFQDVTDVLGLNLYFGWYYGGLDDLEPFLDALRVRDVAVVTYEDRSSLFAGTAPPRGAAATAEGNGSGKPAQPSGIAVNAGGRYGYVDGLGTVWEADRPYTTGSWGHVGGTPRLVHPRIAGTNEHALWQATREGVEVYRFDVADGEYDVAVGLVETVHGAPGARVFSVLVNGLPLFREVDLAAEHGRHVAVERTARVPVSGGTGIRIEFRPRAGEPTVAALRLHRR